jgi:hypothetical protein
MVVVCLKNGSWSDGAGKAAGLEAGMVVVGLEACLKNGN